MSKRSARAASERVAEDLSHKAGLALGALHKEGPVGVAVSGGGDSVALLLFAHAWASRSGVTLHVATVDHGLRAESAVEAADVARLSASLGLSHEVLQWRDWDGRGNLQAEARAARRRLLSGWARRRGVGEILLGHTMDDQAETVLMRLARGAGVDGLSGMTAVSEVEGLRWLRPLLDVRRDDLRAWLQARGAEWADDPSNEDLRFDRVRARRALAALADLGLSAEGLAATADRMREAREALDSAAADLAQRAARWGVCGELYLDLSSLRSAPPELSRRLLRAGLMRASGAAYGPRGGAEQKLLSAMLSLRLGGGRTLHGCVIRPHGAGGVVIAREAAAVAEAPARGDLWDGRFEIEAIGPTEGAELGPLGEDGARRLAERREAGLWSPAEPWTAAPRAARLATPALWRGKALIAAPIAGFGDAIAARFASPGAVWPATV